ncbi:5-guanidino-2-oxopentanoate decarboxylase [Paracoccus pacificus]|uniref:5-guanidino-2-oxopentanoate decarboxylase n=1 Tax=Paracoccus pacificus TaxID=1463598 RepID=A0ABW4R2N9_9RHOB
MTTTGEHLMHLLRARGVEVVFGIPGVHTIEMYRGLENSGIRHITPRHEQGAGFMADGYARATGKPGVALIISGPGMTNIMTAMGQAYADSIPMLVISAVNAHGRMGSGEGWLHELPNQQATVSGVAAFSRTINRPEELGPALDQAFAVFEGGRPRPVHLEIPLNVVLMPAAGPVEAPSPLAPPAPSPDVLDQAAGLLSDAARPVILAGGGAHGPVRELAEMLDAPVVMTTNGRGLLAHDHPLAVPLSATRPSVRALVADADVVLALGTEIGPTDYDFDEDGGFRIPGTLIRCDIDPTMIRRGPRAALGLVGDARAAAKGLILRLGHRRVGDGAARAEAARAGADLTDAIRRDLVILDALRDALADCVMVGDSTQLTYSGNIGYAPDRPRSYWSSATGFGTLGYALPAAIGASIGTPDRSVLSLCGDGGLQFTLPELASATEAGARVILILHDNSGYGEIKTHMANAGVAPIGVDLYTPNLAAIARANGWRVAEPQTLDELIDAAVTAAGHDGPTMIRITDRLRGSVPLT